MSAVKFRPFLFYCLLITGTAMAIEGLSFTCLTILDLACGRTFSRTLDNRMSELSMAWSKRVFFGEFDPLTQVRHIPGKNYYGLSVNKHGFIDNGHSNPLLNTYPEKPEGVIRVVMLGGSSTAGLGVKSNTQTIAAFLEKKLNAGADSAYQVLNFGFGGGHTGTELAMFLFKLVYIQPDIVICLDGYNDVCNTLVEPKKMAIPHSIINWGDYSYRYFELMNGQSRRTEIPLKIFTYTSALIIRVKSALTTKGRKELYESCPQYQLSEKILKENPFLDNVTENNLDAMAAFCSQNKITLLCYLQPWALNGKKPLSMGERKRIGITLDMIKDFGFEDDPKSFAPLLQPAFEALEKIYARLEVKYKRFPKIRFISISNIFSNVETEMYVDMVHLAPSGNIAIADRLYSGILENYQP